MVTDDMRLAALDEAAQAQHILVIAEPEDHPSWEQAAQQRSRTVQLRTPQHGPGPGDANTAVLVDALHTYPAGGVIPARAAGVVLLAPLPQPEQAEARLHRRPRHLVPGSYVPDPLGIYENGDSAEFAVERRLDERCYRSAHPEGPQIMAKEAVQALRDAGWELVPPARPTQGP